jgi:hypothetical protein
MTPRKKKPENDHRKILKGFRVTDQENEEIIRLLKFYGYGNESDFFRRAVLGYQEVNRKDAQLE